GAGMLSGQVRASWQAQLIRGFGIGAMLAVAVALGSHLGRTSPIDPATVLRLGMTEISVDGLLAGGTVIAAVLVSVVLVEIWTSRAGPTAVAARLRHQWELGASLAHVATGALFVQLLPGLVAGFAVTVVAALLGAPFEPTGLIVCLALPASAVISDVTVPP